MPESELEAAAASFAYEYPGALTVVGDEEVPAPMIQEAAALAPACYAIEV